MIWSLVKITAFIVAIAFFSTAFALLMDLNGTVTFELFDFAIRTDLTNFVILLLLLIPVFWGAYFLVGLAVAVFNFFVGDETALTRYLNKNRTRRGYEALADSMVAMASGEPALANSKITLAERCLKRPELTGLLAAQAAERMGNTDKAQAVYRQLLQDGKTRFVGVAGILKHALDGGDTRKALQLAKKAYELRPQHEETQNILFRLQSQEEDWIGAEEVLKAKFSQKKFDKKTYHHHRAAILLSQGMQNLDQDRRVEGKSKVIEANKLAPDLIPAATLAARLCAEAGDKRTATRILMTTWNLVSHPDIVSVYKELEPDESNQQRHERFKKLINKTLTQPESRMAMAELAISHKDYHQARRELETLHENAPSVRTYLILAAIERGLGSSEGQVQNLLAAAVTAPKGSQWICNTCHQSQKDWSPLCSNCQDFDSLEWQQQDNSPQTLISSIKLLPLAADSENSFHALEEDNTSDDIITAEEITDVK